MTDKPYQVGWLDTITNVHFAHGGTYTVVIRTTTVPAVPSSSGDGTNVPGPENTSDATYEFPIKPGHFPPAITITTKRSQDDVTGYRDVVGNSFCSDFHSYDTGIPRTTSFTISLNGTAVLTKTSTAGTNSVVGVGSSGGVALCGLSYNGDEVTASIYKQTLVRDDGMIFPV